MANAVWCMELMWSAWKTYMTTNEQMTTTTNKSQNYGHNCVRWFNDWKLDSDDCFYNSFFLLATLFDFVFLLHYFMLLYSIFQSHCCCEWLNGIVNYRRCFTIKINRVWTILEASISGQQIFIVSFFTAAAVVVVAVELLGFYATLLCCNVNEIKVVTSYDNEQNILSLITAQCESTTPRSISLEFQQQDRSEVKKIVTLKIAFSWMKRPFIFISRYLSVCVTCSMILKFYFIFFSFHFAGCQRCSILCG